MKCMLFVLNLVLYYLQIGTSVFYSPVINVSLCVIDVLDACHLPFIRSFIGRFATRVMFHGSAEQNGTPKDEPVTCFRTKLYIYIYIYIYKAQHS